MNDLFPQPVYPRKKFFSLSDTPAQKRKKKGVREKEGDAGFGHPHLNAIHV